MAKDEVQFKEQGGIATMDPSPLRRWIISKLMSSQASEKRMLGKRKKAEKRRLKHQEPHVIEYFHQVDDGYSLVASQVLAEFASRYKIELRCHLVTSPSGYNVAEPELLLDIGLHDAKAIAPYYGLNFPDVSRLPEPENTDLAHRILAGLSPENLKNYIQPITLAVWQDNRQALEEFATTLGCIALSSAKEILTQGNARRAALQHYSSAMFFYAGEWYWGVDRLYHLENRLRELNADRLPDKPLLVPRPDTLVPNHQDNGDLTLEFYASLRSPYTAIVFDRTLNLAKATGVKCVIRPVLPMVMRGVPATKEKGFYILFDVAREARAEGIEYGNVYDPIGQPARNGYALYQWANKLGKGNEFFSNFLRAAFAQGINTNREKGLQTIVEQTNLNWLDAKKHLTDNQWQDTLEANRLTLYESGLWGVPSFRLIDKNGRIIVAAWGQDRLWLVAQEIKKYLETEKSEL